MFALTAEQMLQAALAYHRSGRLDNAEAAYRAILSQQPNHADALHLLGVVTIELGRPAEATVLIEEAVAARPNEPMYHANLGVAYRRLGQFVQAIASLRRAVALSPNFADAVGSLGHALLDGDQPGEAIVVLHRAIELEKNFAEAHAHLADAYVSTGQFEKATAHYEQAIALHPDEATTHLNFALLLLRLGHYREGWGEYEWRLHLIETGRTFATPRWNAEPANGKTILVHAEQGFGDTIHFLRYLPLVRSRSGAARVIFECQPELVSLLQSNRSEAEIVSAPDETFRCDFHIPLLSLPLALEEFEPFSTPGPYLHADPVRRQAWQARLGPKSSVRVGIAWAGNSIHKDNMRRSLSPEALRPILSTPGVSFYSLQIPSVPTELLDFTTSITDFADTAAFITELDLVITVDTAVAHLAGAMGRPVWVLLPFVADWRWGVQSESIPWYPTMRLFRQRTMGDWDEVIQRVAATLATFVSPH